MLSRLIKSVLVTFSSASTDWPAAPQIKASDWCNMQLKLVINLLQISMQMRHPLGWLFPQRSIGRLSQTLPEG